MQLISPTELKQKLDSGEKYTILDIRENYERDICKIEPTLHIPMDQVTDRIEDIPLDKPIAVLCRSGKRATAVANLLKTDFDRANIFIVEGGILAWIDQVDGNLEAY